MPKFLFLTRFVTVLIGSIFFTFSHLYAQNNFKDTSTKNYFVYRSSIHYGALLGYRRIDPIIIFPNTWGVEFAASKLSTGNQRWEKMYNYPSKVIALAYYNYGIPHDYGEAFSTTTAFDFTLIRKPRRKLWLATGIGLVYSTKKHDLLTNPANKAISTDISYVLQGNLRYDYSLTNCWIANASLSFRHFSNATLGVPNNGMNFPLIGAGISYQPNVLSIKYQKDTLKSFDKSIHFTISAGLAIKRVFGNDKRHEIYALSFYADRPITKWNSIMLGIDAFYNNSLHSEYIKLGKTVDDSSIDHRQLALTFGQELFIGKIGIITQGGVFVYRPHKFRSSVYQKYGVKYYITKDLFLGSIVKVFTGTADYMEWVAGMKF